MAIGFRPAAPIGRRRRGIAGIGRLVPRLVRFAGRRRVVVIAEVLRGHILELTAAERRVVERGIFEPGFDGRVIHRCVAAFARLRTVSGPGPDHLLEFLPFGLLGQLVFFARVLVLATRPPALAAAGRGIRGHERAVGAYGVALVELVLGFVLRLPQASALEPLHGCGGLLHLQALQRGQQLVGLGGAKRRGLAVHEDRPVGVAGRHSNFLSSKVQGDVSVFPRAWCASGRADARRPRDCRRCAPAPG